MGGSLTTEQKLRLKTCKQTGGINLNMKNCELMMVPKQLLKMKNLEKINFTQNRLTEIPIEVVVLDKLRDLDVSWNNITSLTVLFSQLQLTKLNLSGNQIKEMQDLNQTLQILDLSSNQLRELSINFLTSIKKCLKELSLSLNQLSSMDVFDGLDNLEVLNLSSNNITSIPKVSMASLQSLNLSKNQLKDISGIGSFPKLTYLDLSMNAIQKLPTELFGAKALQEINLHTNQIPEIPDQIGNLINLVSIDASTNVLKFVSPQIGSLLSLRSLILHTNPLIEIPFTIGWLYKTLRKLNLANTKIKNIPGEFSFFPTSIELTLTNTDIKPFLMQAYNASLDELFKEIKTEVKAFPPKCSAEGSAISSAISATPVSFSIISSDFLGQKKSKGGDIVKSYIADKTATFREDVIVKDNKDGTYTGFYNLAKEGTFFLNIFIYDEPIKGSPFTLELVPKKQL